MSDGSASDARPLHLSGLPRLSDLGFDGGRAGFRRFCETAFAPNGPRYLTTNGEDLVVFRHADLRAFGPMETVANVPPAVLFPFAYPEGKCPLHDPGPSLASVISNQVFTANPPIHGPVRRLLLNQIGPRPAQGFEPLARAVAEALIADLKQDQIIDLVGDLAEGLTADFWGAVLHLERDEIDAVRTSVRAMTPMLHLQATPEQLKAVDGAFAIYGAVIERGVLRSLATGDDKMLEAMAAELAAIDLHDDPTFAGLVPKTVGRLLAGNLFEGFHTAAIAVVNVLYALSTYPEAKAALNDTPERMDAVIAEALRLEPPVLMLRRRMSADTLYDGALILEGVIVHMFWAAGNHDPDAFAEPHRFDATRSHRGLTTFGGGAHICPGRFVASMLCKVVLETLAAHRIDLRRADDREPWLANHLMAQLDAFNVRVDLAMAD